MTAPLGEATWRVDCAEAPPVAVSSWIAADAIYRWYCRAQGTSKTYYRLAIRALSQLAIGEQLRVVKEELANSLPTVSSRRERKGKEGKGTTPKAKASAPPAEPQAPTPREDSPAQVAANACLAIWGLTHENLTKEQAATYYKAMNKQVADLTGGAEELQAWADQEVENGKRVLGSGSKPETSVPKAVRKEVTASEWQAVFAAKREAGRNNGKLKYKRPDGGFDYESQMAPERIASIRRSQARGEWDNDFGMEFRDERHPQAIAEKARLKEEWEARSPEQKESDHEDEWRRNPRNRGKEYTPGAPL